MMRRRQKITSVLTAIGAGIALSAYASRLWNSCSRTVNKIFKSSRRLENHKKKDIATED